MRLRQRITILLCTVILILSLAAVPALAGITVQLNFDGNGIVYEGTPITIRATVYDENGILITNPAVEWSLDPAAGILSAVYGEAVTFTPARPAGLDRWDSVVTVTRAAYGGATAELPLTIYPGEAKDDPLARAKVYLRGQQSASGYWTGPWGDWAAIALAIAGEDLDADQWLKGERGHLDAVRDAVYAWDVNNVLTTTVARTLLTVATARKTGANVNPRDFGGQNLIDLLQGRQDPETGHFGNAQETTYINAHVWSILALSAAGVQIPDTDQAEDWLRHCQNSDGSWGYDTVYVTSDPDMTAAALRALHALGVGRTDSAVATGLDFLKGFQKPSGGFAALAYDEYWRPIGPATTACADTTAEVLMALNDLAINPREWAVGVNNPVDYLSGLQLADGSFAFQEGSQLTNTKSTSASLMALAYTNTLFPGGGGGNPGGPGSGGNDDSITVTAGVRGLDGATMYAPRPVELGPGEQTPLGALEALGAHVTTGFGGGYVVAIDGLAEKDYGPSSGWIYVVNGDVPSAAADNCPLEDGDDVLWRYVRSLAETGEFAPEELLGPSLPPALADGVAALEQVLSSSPAAAEGTGTTVLPGEPLAGDAAAALARALAANRVDLAQEVTGEVDTLVGDEFLEAAVRIPAGGLDRTVSITVRERDPGAEQTPAPLGRTFASGVYDFGPDGQTFRQPATVYVRCLPAEGRSPADLTLAWFDPQAKAWRLLPAAYDPASGLLAGRTTHFTRFAALTPAGPRPAFTDLDPDGEAWYAGAVTDLAARGVISADEGPAFNAQNPVTRATFTGWLARGLALLPGPDPSFTDLGAGHAYRAEIGAAARDGLVRGLPDGFFGPERSLTRQELAAVLVRAAMRRHEIKDLPPGEVPALLASFADGAQVADWARTAVATAVREGLLAGMPDGRLNPLDPVTRAEAAAFVQRLMEHERTVRDAA
ncbi:MAG: S-layer homology domain-containing protein [Thermoanaerobacterales bacterium]|nr:S-layer homology domain-containing protein [Thermoanaerobacterales bacterium]